MCNKNSWGAVCLLAIFSMMYGCGGGSSSSMPDTPTSTPGPVVEPMAIDLTTLPEGYQTASVPEAVTIMAGMNQDIGDVNFACASGGADCMISMADDGTLQSMGGMVTVMNSATALAAIANIEAAADEARMAAEATAEEARIVAAAAAEIAIEAAADEARMAAEATAEEARIVAAAAAEIAIAAAADEARMAAEATAEEARMAAEATAEIAIAAAADEARMAIEAAAEEARMAAEATAEIAIEAAAEEARMAAEATAEEARIVAAAAAEMAIEAAADEARMAAEATAEEARIVAAAAAEMAIEAAAEDARMAQMATYEAMTAATAATTAAMEAMDAVYAATLADPAAAKAAADAATAAAMDATTAAAAVDAADSATVTAANDAATAANNAATAATIAATALDMAQATLADARMDQMVADEAAARIVAGYIGPDSTRADGIPVTVTDNTDATIDGTGGPPMFVGDDTADDATDDFIKSTEAVAALGRRWTGGKYTRTLDMKSDTIVKYMDRAANTDSGFATYFSVTRDGVELTVGDTGALTLNDEQVGNHGLFSIDFGLDSKNQSNPIEHATGETSTEFTGSFTGVPGTFECTGISCAVHSDEDGNLDELTGTWIFTPDGIPDGIEEIANDEERATALDTAISVPDVVPDADYMIFGYWLQETTDEDGKVARAFSAFADGNQPYGAMTGANAVEGTATYAGPATGTYMKKSLTPDGQPTRPFNSGQFTADAMLSANFGGNDIGANHQFSITGAISNFMDGNDVINDRWVVNLNRLEDDDGTLIKNINTENGMFDGVTDGGTLGSAAGNFSGTFHGPSAGVQPDSASGIFDGHFSNGHVRGAFGTHKQAE